MKFKVGDRVRDREDGEVGTVTRATGTLGGRDTYTYEVDFDDGTSSAYYDYAEGLELIEDTPEAPFNETDIKPLVESIGRLERGRADKLAAAYGFKTKSSGNQDTFEGGGVRDSQAGKARFDLLLPKRVPYAEQLLTRAAAHMARGAEHYGDRNWENMHDEAALERFESSALRHLHQWANGERDEDHAAACYFNLMGAEYVRGILEGKW